MLLRIGVGFLWSWLNSVASDSQPILQTEFWGSNASTLECSRGNAHKCDLYRGKGRPSPSMEVKREMAPGAHFPADVLEKVFSFIGKEDIVSCSGVNTLWYETAKRQLAHKYGIQLCRFDRISSKSRDVCLAGDAVQNFSKRRLRKLQTLRVHYDEPGVLPATTLDTIFASFKNLMHLELLNLTYLNENDVNVILEKCIPGFKFRISLRDRGKSKKALAALEEHRELFQDILVEYGLSIEGWFPIPVGNTKFIIPERSKTVWLECLGLKDIECSNFNSLRILKLEKCYALSETSLHTISRLNVTTLSIQGCSASESTWLGCFKLGFGHLNTISITGCRNVTPTVIEVIGTKNLITIKLEINKNVEVAGLPHLYKTSGLESLHIITHQITSNSIYEGVERHWPSLRCLQVEESLFSYNETLRNIEALECLSLLKQIEFIYCNNPSKIMETSRFKS